MYMYAQMETLPEVVAKVIAGAAESGRKLYWKVQESEQGTLVQLVWKSAGCASANPAAEESKVAINWFQPQARDQFILQEEHFLRIILWRTQIEPGMQ